MSRVALSKTCGHKDGFGKRIALFDTGDQPGDNSPEALSAGVTQLVECNLAKVDVAGSNPVSRSKPTLSLHSQNSKRGPKQTSKNESLTLHQEVFDLYASSTASRAVQNRIFAGTYSAIKAS